MDPRMTEEDDGFYVRVRGLPWSATEDDVVKFLADCRFARGSSSVYFTFTKDGRPSGEAYVELASSEDKEIALKHNNQHMGKRYIEVFASRKMEMEYVVKRSGPNQTDGTGDAVLRLRGLPFGCTKEEIAQFFTGYEIVPNGITLVIDHQGRTAGDAYVQFATQEIAEIACSKHMERIGHRYIEIFKSSLDDARVALSQTRGTAGFSGGRSSRPGPYDRMDRHSGGGGRGGYGGRGGRVKGLMDDEMADGYNDRGGHTDSGYGGHSPGSRGDARGGNPGSSHRSTTGHSVHMRGLPFQATERDIADFFRPLNPAEIVLHYSSSNRATGEADVDFATHDDACEAMKKDKSNMQHRYIELFLNSNPAPRGPPVDMSAPRGYQGAMNASVMAVGGLGGGLGGGAVMGMGGAAMGMNAMVGSGVGMGMNTMGGTGVGMGMNAVGGTGVGMGMNAVGGTSGSMGTSNPMGASNWNVVNPVGVRGNNWASQALPYNNGMSYNQAIPQNYSTTPAAGNYAGYSTGAQFGSSTGYGNF